MYGIFRTDKGYEKDNWYCGRPGMSWSKKNVAMLFETSRAALDKIAEIKKPGEELTIVSLSEDKSVCDEIT